MKKSQQLLLFDQRTLNTDRDLHAEMNRVAKDCGLSRDEIVERMNVLASKYGICLVGG